MPLCQRPAGSAKICEHEARRLTESTKSAWLNEQVNSLCNLGESFSMRPYLEPYYMDGDLKIVNFVSDLAFLSNGFLGKLNSLKVQEWCECLYSYHTSDGGFAKVAVHAFMSLSPSVDFWFRLKVLGSYSRIALRGFTRNQLLLVRKVPVEIPAPGRSIGFCPACAP